MPRGVWVCQLDQPPRCSGGSILLRQSSGEQVEGIRGVAYARKDRGMSCLLLPLSEQQQHATVTLIGAHWEGAAMKTPSKNQFGQRGIRNTFSEKGD